MGSIIVVSIKICAIVSKCSKFAIKCNISNIYFITIAVYTVEFSRLASGHNLLILILIITGGFYRLFGFVIQHIVEIITFVVIAKRLAYFRIAISLISTDIEICRTLTTFVDTNSLEVFKQKSLIVMIQCSKHRELLDIIISVKNERPITSLYECVIILAVIINNIIRVMFVKYINSTDFNICFYSRLETADFLDIIKRAVNRNSFNRFFSRLFSRLFNRFGSFDRLGCFSRLCGFRRLGCTGRICSISYLFLCFFNFFFLKISKRHIAICIFI